MQVNGTSTKNNEFQAQNTYQALQVQTTKNKNAAVSVGTGMVLPRVPASIGQHSSIQTQGPLQKISQTIRTADQNLISYFKNNVAAVESKNNPKITHVDIKDLIAIQGAMQQLSSATSNEDKSRSVTSLFNTLTKSPLVGTVNNPEKIQGVAVVGSTVKDGVPAYTLADGKVISRDALVAAQNFNIALETIKIVQGENSKADRLLGLAGGAVALANVNDFLSDENAGYMQSALGVASLALNWKELDDAQRLERVVDVAPLLIQSAKDAGYMSSGAAGRLGALAQIAGAAIRWEDMSDAQRANALVQGGGAIASSLDDLGLAAIGKSAGTLAGGVSGALGVISGTKDAIDVFTALGDLSRSEGREFGAMGVGSAGAAIGAGVGSLMAASAAAATGAYAGAQAGTLVMPVIGTLVGAGLGAAAGYLAGSFGSGKSADQMMRDQWRSLLEKGGFAQKINGAHHVLLSDGTSYNIGYDGNHKLQNINGTMRHTFDVDWGNELAVESIPEAHIFALATGLDPSLEKGALWHRAVAQSLNAATSNAKTQDEVRDNFRVMLANGQVNPLDIALKVEVLRQENTVNDQQYEVYMSKINSLFGTSLAPIDKQSAKEALEAMGYSQSVKPKK